jgi:alanyl-tRNA synthetase
MNDVKETFRSEARNNPDKFFPTAVLREYGYHRKQCSETGRYFWTTDDDRNICGDVEVIGEYEFLNDDFNTPEWSYTDVWEAFASFFESRGYTSVDRYPVTARWRDDADFVAASIYDFQPHVVNGDADPPANPLVIPQYCLRFNDIENVGVTMSHTTGFTMIGQHAFDDEDTWDQDKYFRDLLDWFLTDVGISRDDLILHEDVWSGGGNLGPCIEFFAGGLELANQVYMLYEINGGERQEIPIKVLDMGLGHERVAWFASNEPTLYHATFPETLRRAQNSVDHDVDQDVLDAFIPYAARLNADEVDDIDDAWRTVADLLDADPSALRGELKPFTDLVSVVEHTRTLLIALSDGALPSNVRGGHNLRVILRRCFNIIRAHDWDLTLDDLVDWHADELSDLFPELQDHTEHVKHILSVEHDKYQSTKQDHERLIQDVVDDGGASDNRIIELYDSHGLDPEELKRRAADHDVDITIPDDFWRRVTERHDHSKASHDEDTERSFTEVDSTERLYYDHFDDVEFTGVVERIVDEDDVYHVALNRSAFYPTSGGQEHDTGMLGGDKVVAVYTEGDVVVHVLPEISFDEGDTVTGSIDFDRRLQLSQHHTATHIMTGCARELFGEHVWQAGASKTEEKARLDITHYDSLTAEDERRLQEAVNDVIQDNLSVKHRFYDRKTAEQKYGFTIYQGGAVPGNKIRVVSVDGLDHEACGGTHVPVTGDVKHIEIVKSSKKQDGVVRLEFLAGERAKEKQEKDRQVIDTLLDELGCEDPALIPGRAEEVFQKWKDIKKDKLDEFRFESTERFEGDALDEAANRLKTQRKHVIKTVRKFKDKIDDLLD